MKPGTGKEWKCSRAAMVQWCGACGLFIHHVWRVQYDGSSGLAVEDVSRVASNAGTRAFMEPAGRFPLAENSKDGAFLRGLAKPMDNSAGSRPAGNLSNANIYIYI